MPSGSRKSLQELTRRELIANLWAFGIIGTIITAAWNADLFQTGNETVASAYWVWRRLLGLIPVLIMFAAMRTYLGELRRRRASEGTSTARLS